MSSNKTDIDPALVSSLLLNEAEETGFSEKANIISTLRRENILKPVIYVGMASCEAIAGAKTTLEAIVHYLRTNSIDAEIVEVGCIGLCSEEPIVDIQLPARNRLSFGKVTSSEAAGLLEAVLNNHIPEHHVIGQYKSVRKESWPNIPFIEDHPFFRQQTRILLGLCGRIDPGNIMEYIAHGGYRSLAKTLRNYTPEYVCDLIEKSNLRGRGGKGFSTGLKWKLAKNVPGDQKFIICNADESDPGAFMDRALLEGNPHLVIEGIAIAAYAVGATKAYIHIRKEYGNAGNKLEQAIVQARAAGLLGSNILGSGVSLSLSVRSGVGAFVCGEETALIASLEGKRGMPHHKPPFPTQQGLFSKPTVVNNVETLANVPLIVQRGPQWYNTIGTARSKGTKVFAVSGKVKYTGLIEVPLGTTLRKMIVDIAGGTKDGKALKAVHMGGPSGNSLPESMLDLPVDFEMLEQNGIMMGSGGVVVMDETTCMPDIARYFIHFMKKESCGKCIPCREGTRRIAEIMDSITRRPLKESGHDTLQRFKGIMQLEGLASVMKSTSLCGLGKTAANPVLSTIKWFRDEYEEHIFDRNCKAGVCRDLRTFYIDVALCTGCTLCAAKCPVNAIYGTPQHPYFVVEDKCIGCGICRDVCKFSAVFVR